MVLEKNRVTTSERRLGRLLLWILSIDSLPWNGLKRGDSIGLLDRIGPRDGNRTSLVKGWLAPVRGGEVVNHEQISLLPAAEDHVLVDRLADLSHFLGRDLFSVSVGSVQAHLVAENSILNNAKDENKKELE